MRRVSSFIPSSRHPQGRCRTEDRPPMARRHRRPGSPPVLLSLFTSALFLLAAGGCCHNCEVVETELRDRECKLREMIDEVDRLRCQNTALGRELGVKRSTESAKAMPSPELSSQSYTLSSVELGMQTGGYNN